MAFFNYANKEITLKVVYYGPALSGKTTSLQFLHSVLDPSSSGKLISLSTESDRTLFFDFLPVDMGKIKDFSLRFQVFTVPGQIRYNSTRKLVLKGADAIVFVADSQKIMKGQNIESFDNMRENLHVNNIDPDGIPIVLQYNKRDLYDILSLEELENDLNKNRYKYSETMAVNGYGVKEAFDLIKDILLSDIAQKYRVDIAARKKDTITVKVQEKTVIAPGYDRAETIKVMDRTEMPTPAQMEKPAPVQAERPIPAHVEKPAPVQAERPIPVKTAASVDLRYQDEKINSIINIASQISKTLTEIKDNFSTNMQNVTNATKLYSEEIKELRTTEKEIANTLSKINNHLENINGKKGWLKIFSK